MKVLLKRFSVLILLSLTLVSLACRKNTPVAVPGPPPAPPAPPPPAAAAPAPTITLRSDNTAITAGQSATLIYTATNATSVTISPGVGAVQPTANGTRQVSPTAATTYTAEAIGPGGRANSAGVTITVNPATVAAAPPPAPPPAPVNRGPDAATIFRNTMTPVLFDYDKSTIRADQESKLLSMASYLKQNANVRFTIEGHADERGGQEYNIALGDERAASVRRYFSGQGVAESRMTVVSFGEEKPVCSETTEDCYQRNRRDSFVLQP